MSSDLALAHTIYGAALKTSTRALFWDLAVRTDHLVLLGILTGFEVAAMCVVILNSFCQ